MCLNYIWEWSIHYSSLSTMFIPLHSSTNQELFKKYAFNQGNHYEKTRWCRVPQLSSETEVSIVLLCQLCLTRYTAVRIMNCLKSTYVIKADAMKNVDDFHYAKDAIMCNCQINAVHCEQKMNGTQRRTLVRPWRMHFTYCGMPKGTSWAEATSNSEKIKPIALAQWSLLVSWVFFSVPYSPFKNFQFFLCLAHIKTHGSASCSPRSRHATL